MNDLDSKLADVITDKSLSVEEAVDLVKQAFALELDVFMFGEPLDLVEDEQAPTL